MLAGVSWTTGNNGERRRLDGPPEIDEPFPKSADGRKIIFGVWNHKVVGAAKGHCYLRSEDKASAGHVAADQRPARQRYSLSTLGGDEHADRIIHFGA